MQRLRSPIIYSVHRGHSLLSPSTRFLRFPNSLNISSLPRFSRHLNLSERWQSLFHLMRSRWLSETLCIFARFRFPQYISRWKLLYLSRRRTFRPLLLASTLLSAVSNDENSVSDSELDLFARLLDSEFHSSGFNDICPSSTATDSSILAAKSAQSSSFVSEEKENAISFHLQQMQQSLKHSRTSSTSTITTNSTSNNTSVLGTSNAPSQVSSLCALNDQNSRVQNEQAILLNNTKRFSELSTQEREKSWEMLINQAEFKLWKRPLKGSDVYEYKGTIYDFMYR